MNWVPTEGLGDIAMIHLAAKRATVRLDDGRISTLVGWPGGDNRSRTSRRGRYARLHNNSGVGFTVHVSRVVEVDSDG